MSAESDKVRSIFAAAVDLDSPAQRAAYLDEACGADARLRAEVDELLAHDDAAGSFLESPLSALAVDPGPTDAEKALRQSLECHEEQLARNPANASSQERLTWRPLEASQLDGKWMVLTEKLVSGTKLASVLNNQAWNLAVDPDPQLRDPAQAVELAGKAVELAPTDGSFWNTLGTAHYRAGNWKATISALDQSMELRQGGDSYDWFFLAMAHWRLNDKHTARNWHERAAAWMDANQPQNEELRRFRTEAEELMKED
jgi:tetratricopeptide (TPR) repeat protein